MSLTIIADLAAAIGVNKSTVSRHVAKLGVGTRLGQQIALTQAEAALVRQSIADAKPGNPNAARDGAKSAKKRAKNRAKAAPKKTPKKMA